MLKTLQEYTNDLLHLFFPQYCEGCGSDAVNDKQLLCLRCMSMLPETGFFTVAGNPVEKTFYGRLSLLAAGSAFYFTPDSLMQHLITQLKYHGNRDIGHYLGRLTALQIRQSNRFEGIDCIIPLPLNDKKLRQRGYNQAAVIAEGMAEILQVPVLHKAVIRNQFTETQTKKNRVSRWQTMQDVFEVPNPGRLADKHVLLVDDIVTTGATIEACGSKLLQVPQLRLSVAAVAWTI